MSEYVLVGRSGNDINNAVNRCHEPNTTPLNGVEDKFVTSMLNLLMAFTYKKVEKT